MEAVCSFEMSIHRYQITPCRLWRTWYHYCAPPEPNRWITGCCTNWWQWHQSGRFVVIVSLDAVRSVVLTVSLNELTPWSRVLEKYQLVKNFPLVYGMPPAPVLSQINPFHVPSPISWRFILILFSRLRLGLPSGLFPPCFPTKTLHAPLLSPIRATRHAHLILYLITRIIFGEQYRKIKIYRTIILPVVLYGCETWSLTLREERRLRVFKNRVLRVFGPKRDEVTGEWRKLHNEELNDLYCSPNIWA